MSKRPRSDSKELQIESSPAKDALNDAGLVNERFYAIQIGDKLFKLSGASLASDSPSYFTNFFSDALNKNKVLFIDRSSTVFEKIYLHLQGYYIDIQDETEFVYCFADAHYYGLNALKNILFSYDIFTKIGDRSFRISKELITSPGNFPNYFSVSYNALFQDPQSVRALQNLYRPPHLKPPALSTRSPELFADLLAALQGKSISFKDEQHREDLLRECRYYNFLALEQKLIDFKIFEEPFEAEPMILIKLKDLKKKGLKLCASENKVDTILKYSRPFVDNGVERTLVLQIQNSDTSLFIDIETHDSVVEFAGSSGLKLRQVFKSIDIVLPPEEAPFGYIVDIDSCPCVINGRPMVKGWHRNLSCKDFTTCERKARKQIIQFKVLRGQYRLFTRSGGAPWIKALQLEAVNDMWGFNNTIGFI